MEVKKGVIIQGIISVVIILLILSIGWLLLDKIRTDMYNHYKNQCDEMEGQLYRDYNLTGQEDIYCLLKNKTMVNLGTLVINETI